ncbi:MAG: response regulator [Bacteroidetes bacterium]|nr:MAG: response regulator [Bacteroidota bacterium]
MKQPGSKPTARGKIILGFLLATMVVAMGCYYAYYQVGQLAEVVKPTGSEATIDELEKTIGILSQGEGIVMAYVITGDTAALQPYSEMLENLIFVDFTHFSPADSVFLADLINEKLVVEDQIIQILGDTSLRDPYEVVYAELDEALKQVPGTGSRSRSRRSSGRKTKPSTKPATQAEEPPPTTPPPAEEEEIKAARPKKFHLGGWGLSKEEKEAWRKWKEEKQEERRKKRQDNKEQSAKKNKPDRSDIELVVDRLVPKSPVLPEDEPPADFDWVPPQKPQDTKKLVETLKDSIARRDSIYTYKLQEQRDTLLKLVNKDRQLMQQIIQFKENIQIRDAEQIRQSTAKAEQLIQQTPRVIAIFGAAMLLLFVVLLIIIFRDIARNQRLQKRLREENARAQQLAHAKEEFLANMSHDIRTPMNAVIGFTEQLQETPLNRQQRKFLRTIQHSGNYLLGLINDVLDYSKLESGSFELEHIDFSPANVLNQVYETFHAEAEKKGLRLSCQYDHGLPEMLKGDPLRLKQMLFNLTNNAIKFTDKGSISIQARVSKRKNNQVWLAISVKDTGIGIAADKLPAIFREYGQAETATSRKYGGTGLGLSITKMLAEKHGGSIEVESEPGKGTVFTLHLPYELGSHQQAPPEAAAGTPSRVDASFLRGKRILIADDEPFNRFLLETILEKWGVKTDVAENGQQAARLAQKNDYDYVLIDLQMPEMSGTEASAYIRKELGKNMPIVALTATSTPAEAQQALKSGINEVLLKPFKEEHLLHTLYAISQQGAHAPNMAEIILNDMPKYQIDELYKLTGNDSKKVLHLLEIFVKHTPEELRLLQRAARQQNWQQLSAAAHKLIPKVRHLVPAMEPRLRYIKELADQGQQVDQLPALVKEVARQLVDIIVEVEKEIQRLRG